MILTKEHYDSSEINKNVRTYLFNVLLNNREYNKFIYQKRILTDLVIQKIGMHVVLIGYEV